MMLTKKAALLYTTYILYMIVHDTGIGLAIEACHEA